MKAPGEQIRALRMKRGWSQERFAAEMGTTQSSVSRLEATAYEGASHRTMKRAAVALGAVIEMRLVEVRRGNSKVETSGR